MREQQSRQLGRAPALSPRAFPAATACGAAPPAAGPGAARTPVSRGGPGASGAPSSGCRAGRRRSPGRAGLRLRTDPGARRPRWRQLGAGCSRPGEGPWPGCHDGQRRFLKHFYSPVGHRNRSVGVCGHGMASLVLQPAVPSARQARSWAGPVNGLAQLWVDTARDRKLLREGFKHCDADRRRGIGAMKINCVILITGKAIKLCGFIVFGLCSLLCYRRLASDLAVHYSRPFQSF